MTGTATVTVWGRDWTVTEALAKLAELDRLNAEIGASDDRVTLGNALREALAELDAADEKAQRAAKIEAARRRQAATAYRGPMVTFYRTGTTHFVNAWGELYCGREVDAHEISFETVGRASCRKCQQAGDAALREGAETRGGSAARRN